MKALVQDGYCAADALRIADVAVPEPGPDEVQVRVHAAAVNPADWHIMRGDPRIARYLDRTMFGRRGPRQPIRGRDFAGTVTAVGLEVTSVAVGDEVFGEAEGTFAEYAVVPARQVSRKPANLDFARAATVPLAAGTALVCLTAVAAGDRLLINGASGGVGTFAVQLAVARGAKVTAVCSTRNLDLVRSLGAHDVVDYTMGEPSGEFDVVVDLVGNRSVRALFGLLTRRGRLVLSGGGVYAGGTLFGPVGLMIRGQLAGMLTPRKVSTPLAKTTVAGLDELRALIELGQLVPVVDRRYSLDDAAAAVAYVEAGHARGKVVVDIAS